MGPTLWSPFGPQEKKVTITDYGDFLSMFTAFRNGQIDITDFPLLNAAITSLCVDPSFFCTSPISELAIFQLDINHRIPFLGTSLQANRTVPPPSFVLPVTAGSGCTTGFGQLTVNLQNQEQGNAMILDSLNKLTISNQPSGTPSSTVGDSGGVNPTGTYVFPCVLAGTYAISSTIYGTSSPCASVAPTICVSFGSGQSVTATLRVDWNSPSTKQPSLAGTYIGRALSHLLDKPSFVQGVFGNSATFDDEQVAPSQNVPNLFSNTAECLDHPWFSSCNPVSAYNLVADSISGGSEWWTLPGQANGVGPGYSGVSDLRAACDDFVKAGFTVVGGTNSTDCGDVALASQGTVVLSSYPHLDNRGQHVFNALRANQGRKEFGIIMGDSINFLFGTPNNGCTVLYFGTSCTPKTVSFFQAICVFQQTCPWNIYQGGSSLDQVPEHLYNDYHSAFSSSFCGGPPVVTLGNYPVYCDPQFDTYASAGEFSHTLPQSIQFFAQAAASGSSNGMTVPVFTRIDQFSALNGWNLQQCGGLPPPCFPSRSSLVNTLGGGFLAGYGYWSLLNMRQVPGYVPPSPGFAPGGGDPNLIRRGFSEDTFNVSPFQAVTTHETEIVSLIYDSMLQANPLTGGGNGQVVDWQTISHASTFNPSEISCNALNGCITGTTTSIWQLRNDLNFQDGTPFTADDVVYTMLAFRDVPSASFQYLVNSVSGAVALNAHTVQVKLQGQSAFAILDLGSVPIIPKHIWEPICGPIVNGAIPGGSTSPCASPTFDPMAQGIMIGSGPWQCVVPAGFPNAGHVGGSCTITHPPTCSPGVQTSCLSGGSLTPGDQMLLTRYNNFARCCPDDTSSSLYKLSWADKNNDGLVNILDLANIASHYGQADPYWVNSNIALGSTVNAVDLATVAIYFGHGTTYPFRPLQLTDLDPQIDPFFCPATGC